MNQRSSAWKQAIGSGLLSIVVGVTIMFAASVAQAKQTVKIAFIGPLTGGTASNGLGGRNSADLAIKLRNARSDSKYKYELVVLDDECKPNVGVQVATKAATDQSIIAGVTHYCSTVGIATVDVYNRFGLPVVVWGAVLPEITYGNNHKEIHRVNGTMIDENRVAAQFLTGLGYKRWAVIYDTTDYGKAQFKYFEQFAKENGGTILGAFGVGADQQDFTAELLKIKELKPQIIYFGGLTPLAVRIRNQMEKLNIDAQFEGVSGIMSAAYLETLGPLSEGTIAFHNGAPFETLPGGREFVQRYQEQKYNEPPDAYGPFAYAAANLVMDAIEKAGPNRKKVRDVLNKTRNYESLVGVINFDDHRQNLVNATKYVAQDGKWVRWEDSEYAAGKRKLKGL